VTCYIDSINGDVTKSGLSEAETIVFTCSHDGCEVVRLMAILYSPKEV
jgi:hypothetical protein